MFGLPGPSYYADKKVNQDSKHIRSLGFYLNHLQRIQISEIYVYKHECEVSGCGSNYKFKSRKL